TDPSAFVTQLTQLSQMEALQSLAKQGQANGAALESLQVLQLGGQIGSQVMVQTDTLAVSGEPVRGQLTLANGSDAVSLVIESDSGRQVRVPLGTRGAGVVPFTLDPAALGLVDGIYAIRAETSDETAAPPVEVQGVLRGVNLSHAGRVTVAISSVGDTTPDAITAFNGRPAGH
ncbi:MAG TPA: FlgD immunoglobulin-like domain containing protein, partial [Polyangiaceae bacterium]|nr:FlgD immunoglobulin-like domain containing protein [Polyangiaceae bacterium]